MAIQAVKLRKEQAKVQSKPKQKEEVFANPEHKRIAGTVGSIKPGHYSDGIPYNEIQYLACKLILRPNHFTSRASLFDFAKVMRRPAKEHGVVFSTDGFENAPLKIREVLFMDTPDFRFYNNAFILRRRIPYQDGFPSGDAEIVFKFRHTDMQLAAETDVRPHIFGDFRIKFKAQVLPLKTSLGGARLLFSHNVQFPVTSVKENDPTSMDTIMRVFPVLQKLKKVPGERLELVGNTIVEEVLQDIGMIDFGNGLTAGVNVALWRTRGEHRPLIGEFAFQHKFRNRKDLRIEATKRAEDFFLALQYAAKDWIALDSTKTGVVYRLKGNKPQAHE